MRELWDSSRKYQGPDGLNAGNSDGKTRKTGVRFVFLGRAQKMSEK